MQTVMELTTVDVTTITADVTLKKSPRECVSFYGWNCFFPSPALCYPRPIRQYYRLKYDRVILDGIAMNENKILQKIRCFIYK